MPAGNGSLSNIPPELEGCPINIGGAGVSFVTLPLHSEGCAPFDADVPYELVESARISTMEQYRKALHRVA